MNHENYDLSFPDQPIVDQYLPIWASLPAFRSKPAFIWPNDGSTNVSNGSILTYGQLNDSVQSISCNLLCSLKRSETVVILCSPGLELVEIIFGCQRAGLLSVPIFPPDPSFAKENYHHLARVLSQTKPKAAIADNDYIKKVQQYLSLPSKDKRLAEMLQNMSWISTADIKQKRVGLTADSMFYNGCKTDEIYLIQYTSGATGIPKPVLVTAGSAAHNVRTARKAYDLHPNSVIVSWLPQYHDCGLMFLLLTIISGATCVLASPGAFVKRPRLWLELITEFKATCTPVPSFTLPLVVKRGGVGKGRSKINLWSLRNLIIINEPIYKASVDEFLDVFKPYGLKPSSISPSYGLAENCTFVSTAWRNDDISAGNSSFPNFPSYNKLLPSARLANEEEADMNIIVVNEDTHEPVEDGIEGEIWVSSPSNASGYLGHPFLTQDIFKGSLSNKVGRCFVRTGDRGIVKGEQRFLFVTGRCLDIIKLSNGQEIHPHYIETAAYDSCPQFIRGGCLAAFDFSRMIVLVAEMQRSEKDDKILKNICERIREDVLNKEKVEIGMVVLVSCASVPKTTSGKIQRWAAKDNLLGGKMNVLMEMKFDNYHWGLLPSPGAMIHASNYRDGQRRARLREGEGRRVLVAEEKEEIQVSLSSAAVHHPGLSRL
ncbi:AMP-dependent synthetase/ligase [Corchorus olitorius]|uniref:AMP-dependent synthetase/ligase n=1 Tax=Corchorus olitorius TaxID=93759 RepID=A0A1R3HXN2_9ROSI|nr:AMP-dependent synthetase/ligase [Corchorus olitorius]